MTRYGSADVAFLLLDGRDILGDTTQLEDTLEAMTEEVTALGDSWEAHAPVGVTAYRLTQQGFFNDAVGRSNAMFATPGTGRIIAFAPEGNEVGKRMTCAQGIQATYTRQIQRGALHKANANYESTGQADECRIVFPLGAVTEDSDSTDDPLDGGAQSTAGAVAYLEVTALDLDGYDSVTITLIDDADDMGVYGVLDAFAPVTGIGAQRIEIPGTIERYVAVDVAFDGSGTAPSITFVVGLKRN